jgi:hypothetical protein
LADPTSVPRLFLAILAFAGVAMSLAWYLVAMDDRRWQLVFNQVIANLERSIFEPGAAAFYQTINSIIPQILGEGGTSST